MPAEATTVDPSPSGGRNNHVQVPIRDASSQTITRTHRRASGPPKGPPICAEKSPVICHLDPPPKAVLIAPDSRPSKPSWIDVDFGASFDPRSRLENRPDSASGFAAQSFSQWATDDDPPMGHHWRRAATADTRPNHYTLSTARTPAYRRQFRFSENREVLFR